MGSGSAPASSSGGAALPPPTSHPRRAPHRLAGPDAPSCRRGCPLARGCGGPLSLAGRVSSPPTPSQPIAVERRAAAGIVGCEAMPGARVSAPHVCAFPVPVPRARSPCSFLVPVPCARASRAVLRGRGGRARPAHRVRVPPALHGQVPTGWQRLIATVAAAPGGRALTASGGAGEPRRGRKPGGVYPSAKINPRTSTFS